MKNFALGKIDNYKGSVHILTFYSVRLSDDITIFTAELCAIKLVISNSDKNVCIFSDSYSSLQAIASGKSNCRPILLLQVIRPRSRK